MIVTCKAFMSVERGRELSNFLSFTSGIFGGLVGVGTIISAFRENMVGAGIASDVFAVASWALYLHTNCPKHNS